MYTNSAHTCMLCDFTYSSCVFMCICDFTYSTNMCLYVCDCKIHTCIILCISVSDTVLYIYIYIVHVCYECLKIYT